MHTIRASSTEHPYLVVTAGDVHCALPLQGVAEISRPPQGELPTSIVLRGREMRLFDLAAMMGKQDAPKTRIVRLCLPHGREAAVAVSTVPGARLFDPGDIVPLDLAPEAMQTPYPDAAEVYAEILHLLSTGGRLTEASAQMASSDSRGQS